MKKVVITNHAASITETHWRKQAWGFTKMNITGWCFRRVSLCKSRQRTITKNFYEMNFSKFILENKHIKLEYAEGKMEWTKGCLLQ